METVTLGGYILDAALSRSMGRQTKLLLLVLQVYTSLMCLLSVYLSFIITEIINQTKY